jgi:S1-C subfamily serine protease
VSSAKLSTEAGGRFWPGLRSSSCARYLLCAAMPSVLMGLGLSTPASAQTARSVAQSTSPSVVLLATEDANGQPLSIGSGFVVGEGVIATNLHVIEGANSGYAKPVGQKDRFDILGIVGLDKTHDLVLLSVKEARAPALPLGESGAVAVGDGVFVVGNPYGLEGTFSEGIVSSLRSVAPDSLLQITAPISPGSSGGPVLNSRGEVIGVAVATFKDGQNLNFAIPVSYLKALLGQVQPLKPLSVARKSPQTQSPLRDIGGSSVRGVVGTQFAWGIQLVEGPAILLSRIDFTFSLQNQLRVPVKNVQFILIFYDRLGKPLEVYDSKEEVLYEDVGTIRPGLAKRAKGSVDVSLRRLTSRAEIRVLGFEVTE